MHVAHQSFTHVDGFPWLVLVVVMVGFVYLKEKRMCGSHIIASLTLNPAFEEV